LCVVFLTCCPCSRQDSLEIIEGRIYLTGNDPFIRVAVEADDGCAYILDCSEELKSKLMTMQNQTVQVICSHVIIRNNYRLAVVQGINFVE